MCVRIPGARYIERMNDRPKDNDDEDDDWPEPIHTPEERRRAAKAYAATFELRRKALRYGYVVLGLLVVLVIILAITH